MPRELLVCGTAAADLLVDEFREIVVPGISSAFALTVPLLEEELDWAAAEVHTLAVEPQLAAVLALAAAKPTWLPHGVVIGPEDMRFPTGGYPVGGCC